MSHNLSRFRIFSKRRK